MKLTFAWHLLVPPLQRLLRASGRTAEVPVTLIGSADQAELIATQAAPAGGSLHVQSVSAPSGARLGSLPTGCLGVLLLGIGPLQGWMAGWGRVLEGGWEPFESLAVVGPGMVQIPLHGNVRNPQADLLDRWSRTRGALRGDTHRRLTRLRIGCVGLGRLGSVLMRNLVRTGVREVVVVDPDMVELHNLGEGEFEDADIGRTKVAAWAERHCANLPWATVETVAQSVSHPDALERLRRCDVIIAAADHAAGRLPAGAVATAYSRVLMDVGTWIPRPPAGHPRADVRLITPEHCLLCFGGVQQEAQALPLLRSGEAEARFHEHRDWEAERAGSLRSVNELGVALAQRQLEGLVSGQIRASTWCHAEEDASGQLVVTYPQTTRDPRVRCFCGFMGWGDAGLAQALPVLEQRASAIAGQQAQARASRAPTVRMNP